MKRGLGTAIVLAAALALTVLLTLPGAAQEPKQGGRLIVATQQDPITMLGAVSTHLHSHMVADTMYSGLVRQKWDDPKPYPDLAERWEISGDGKVYTFHLVKNATWHDGKPFTSADVKFSIEEVIRKNHPAGGMLFGTLDRVDTPDPYTAVIVLKQPFVPLMSYLMSKMYGTIVPKHIYEGTDIKTNPHNFSPIGTGPFKFKEYVKGSHVRVVRNENYFRKGQPYLDEVVIRIIPDWSAMVAAFETGEVNYMCWGIPRHELPRLEKLPGVAVNLKTPLTSLGLWTRFNLRHEALSKLKVRQAIAYATDKKEILEKAFFNQGSVAESFVNPNNVMAAWAYDAKTPTYEYNVQKANALLDEAGVPRKADGIRFSMRQYNSASDIEATKTNEILREQWRKVGIDVKVMPLEGTAYPQLVYNKWDFESAMGFWFFGPDPGLIGLHVHSRQIKQGLAPGNIMGYSNTRIDELLDKAAMALDQKQRAAMYGEVASILAQDVPTMWFTFGKDPFVFHDRFVGLPTPAYGFSGWYDEIWSKTGK
jgi:peptide/nickel transport system substrate-binding protein